MHTGPHASSKLDMTCEGYTCSMIDGEKVSKTTLLTVSDTLEPPQATVLYSVKITGTPEACAS